MKKWTYLVAAGILLGATPVFTGCIDNDEPEGITLLRGAKAELLKAKATVEEANAAWILAKAQYDEALARHEAALALEAEYKAEMEKLKNEMKAAQNERDKVQLQKEIEALKQDMEENALKHKTEMIRLQGLQEQTQRNYELILKQIAIAKAVASDQGQVTIANLEAKLQKAYAILYGGTYTEGKTTVTINSERIKNSSNATALAAILYEAEEELYNASMKKAQGKDEDGKTDSKLWIPSLKLEVEKQEAVLNAANEALTKLQEFLDKDTETTDWRAEITKLEDAIKDLNKQISQKQVDLEKAQNSDSYLAAVQGVNGVYAVENGESKMGKLDEDGLANNPDEAISDGAYQVKLKAEKALNTKKKETAFELAEYKVKVDVTDAMVDALKAAEEANPDFIAGEYTSWAELGYAAIDEYKYWNSKAEEGKEAIDLNVEEGTYPTEIEKLITNFDYWLEIVNATTVNDNDVAWAKAKLENAQKAEAEAKKVYDVAIADWKIAADAVYGKAAPVPTTELQKVLTAYNTQYAALKTAIDAYNKAYNAAYDKAYDEEMAKQAISYKFSDVLKTIGDIDGFNKSAASTSCGKVEDVNKTEAKFAEIIKNNCAKTTDKTQAEVEATVLAAIKTAVDTAMGNAKYTSAAKTAGDTAAKKTDKTAVEAAKTKVTEAYGKIDVAITAYDKLAATPYGQKSTKDADKLLTKESLVGVKGAVDANWYKTNAKTNNFEILNSEITAEEVTAATKTVIDEDTAKAALKTTSMTAFGADNYLSQPSEKDIRENAGTSKGYLWYVKKDDVKKQEDIIAAEPELKKLQAQLEADYKALIEGIQKEYDDAFSKETAAVEKAEEALEAAQKVWTAEKAKFNDIEVEIAKLQAQANAQGEVKGQLIEAALEHLGIEWPKDESGNSNKPDKDKYDTKSFVKALEAAVQTQKEAVATAEQNLAIAKADLQKAEEGKYDAVAKAERDLKLAQQEYDKGAAAYETALANLQKGLEIMSESAE